MQSPSSRAVRAVRLPINEGLSPVVIPFVREGVTIQQGVAGGGGQQLEAPRFDLHACFIYARLGHEADILPSWVAMW